MQKKLLDLIEKYKEEIVDSDTWREVCKTHKVDPNFIFLFPVTFAKLDVSARTENGVVYLNWRLLKDPDSICGYLTHEFSHILQQCFGDGPTTGSNEDSYLDNPFEQEGFQNQTSYIEETEGPEEADAYIEKVLDHHCVPENEKEDRKKELLAIVKNIRLNKFAGMFKAPAELLQFITDNALSLFAGQVWARTIQNKAISSKNKEEIIVECRKYIGSPHQTIEDKSKFTIPLSQLVTEEIRNWNYIKNVDKTYDEMLTELKEIKYYPWPDNIDIIIYFTKDSAAKEMGKDPGLTLSGRFDLRYKRLLALANTEDIKDSFTLRHRISNVISVINHENNHMFQLLLTDIKDLDQSAGIPGKKFRSGREDVYGRPQIQPKSEKDYFAMFEEDYAPIAEEFANSVRRFNRIIKRDEPYHDLTIERAKAWVGFPNNFAELADKYGRPEPEFTSPLFLKLEKKNINAWKTIANKFIFAVIRTSKVSLQGEHTARDFEFYTNLQDAVHDFNWRVHRISKELPDYNQLKTEFAKRFVGEPNNFVSSYMKYFLTDTKNNIANREILEKMRDTEKEDEYYLFRELKEHSTEKWKKAVKEFMKAVGL